MHRTTKLIAAIETDDLRPRRIESRRTRPRLMRFVLRMQAKVRGDTILEEGPLVVLSETVRDDHYLAMQATQLRQLCE